MKKKVINYDNKEAVIDLFAIDSNFVKLFDLTTSIGSLDEIGRSVDKVALTVKTAKKLYGDADPLGKVIKINDRNYTVSSIINVAPTKTTFQFDAILPIADFNRWYNIPYDFFLMPKDFDYNQFNAKYSTPQYRYDKFEGELLKITPLSTLYFNKFNSDLTISGDRQTINILFLVALIVLVIGVFNFINIYTVLMLRRSKEVGVKKVFGASTNSILAGIYLENLIMVIAAVLGGWIVTYMCKDFASGTLGIPIVQNWNFDILLSTSFVVLLPIITTIYPYIKYRYAKPITSLQEVSTTGKSIISRAVFLVLQYVMTVVIVIFSIYFVRQLSYMLNSELGYRHKGIIAAKVFHDNNNYDQLTSDKKEEEKKKRERKAQNITTFTNTLSSSPLIEKFSFEAPPISSYNVKDGRITVSISGSDEKVPINVWYTSQGFYDLYKIDFVEGRNWNDSIDVGTQYRCIVNESLLKSLSISNWQNITLQTSTRLWWQAGNSDDEKAMKQNPPFEIVGVVKDFNAGHLSKSCPPMMMIYWAVGHEDANDGIYVLPKEGKTQEVVALLEKLHGELGNGEFSCEMVSDQVADLYKEDKKVTIIYSTFAVIAILIGALGLFSLSLYDVQQRRREIALRRVHGAQVNEIVKILLGKYFLLLGIAFLIAMPLAWFAIDWYMKDFVHRAPISWWIFLVGAIVTAAISLLTLIWQTYKAAAENPANLMKKE